ncbi:hypothetical protein D1007_47234 [Hordeum vulgare]|nr:hypothetical protein D1007_47234 [Hordeum vulgare]
MSFSGAVQWWDAWQLRVLVLGSLFIQYFLFFFSMVRQLALPSWLRLFSWLAYLGGDALAIYALATLFNRHKQLPADGSGLEVLWTPVLLIHLGGQHTMTAYNIEDNELWARHAITVVSQITVALFVFCKSWSGEKRLLQAAILLFVVGIIRSIQKPWALQNASISGMTASLSPSARREQGLVALMCGMCTSVFGTKLSKKGREEEAAEEIDIPLEEFVQEASRCVPRSELESGQVKAQDLYSNAVKISGQLKPQDLAHVCMLLVDISTPYSSRIKNLHLLMALDYPHAYRLSSLMLNGLLYTKLAMLFSGLGLCLHHLLPFLTFASTILFSTSHKYHDYNATDVKITYILFFSTMLLDFLLLLLGIFIGAIVRVKIPQYSFWSFCARKKRPTILMKIATVVCCKDYVNMHCYIQHAPAASSLSITNLVLGYVRDGWTRYIHDAASYRRFNSHRGQWTLNKHSDIETSQIFVVLKSILKNRTESVYRGVVFSIEISIEILTWIVRVSNFSTKTSDIE